MPPWLSPRTATCPSGCLGTFSTSRRSGVQKGRVLRERRERGDLEVDHRVEAVGQVVLVTAVNDDTIHAVSMVATFDRTGTMILAGSSDLREEPVLEPVTRCVISAPERLHCLLLYFVVVDSHGAPPGLPLHRGIHARRNHNAPAPPADDRPVDSVRDRADGCAGLRGGIAPGRLVSGQVPCVSRGYMIQPNASTGIAVLVLFVASVN